MVLHTCDVRACVRPDHLFLGTAADNTADMLSKGRYRSVRHPGEANGIAKLTAAQVIEIRKRDIRARGMKRQLAREFGVSPSLIWTIVTRRGWKHVLD
jgi:hypothetical protein